jgi:tryptophan-rich sensory protein
MALKPNDLLKPLEAPNRVGWFVNLAVFVGGATLVNALIFGLGWNDAPHFTTQRSFDPPDAVTAVVWVILLGMLATARWWLNAGQTPEVSRAKHWVTGLCVVCLLWPFYALATDSVLGGLIGCVLTALLGILTVWRIVRLGDWTPWLAAPATLLVVPMILWVLFATVVVAKHLGH